MAGYMYNTFRYNGRVDGYPFVTALADSITSADAITKNVSIVKTDTTTITETFAKSVTTRFADSVGITDQKSAGPNLSLYDATLLHDQFITIDAELSDTVRLEDWISLILRRNAIWTEDSKPSGAWSEVDRPADNPWTEETPPSDDPWSH